MTTAQNQMMDNPPSDIDVDLSSENGSERPIGEAEAANLLLGTKAYGYGSESYAANPRRMDFSPTPSPPPPNQQQQPQQQQQQQQHLGPTSSASMQNKKVPTIQPMQQTPVPEQKPQPQHHNGSSNLQNAGSDAGSVKEGSVELNINSRAKDSPAASGSHAATTPARARTSIWVHFTRDPDYSTNRRGRCVYCHNYYSCSSGSTGNMWRHIKRTHPERMHTAVPLETTPHPPKQKKEPHAPTPIAPSATAGGGTASSHDPRPPRKRIASFSSQTNDGSGSPTAAVAMRSPPQHHQESVYNATRNLEEAIRNELGDAAAAAAAAASCAIGMDGNTGGIGSNVENLAHLTRILLTLANRNHADRPGSLLESLNAITSGGGGRTGGTALGNGDMHLDSVSSSSRLGGGRSSHHYQQQQQQQQQQQPFKTGAGNLPPIAEAAPFDNAHSLSLFSSRGGHLHNSNPYGGGDGGGYSRYHGTDSSVDPDSVSQFIAAVSNAIRDNSESISAANSPARRAQKALNAYVDFMVRDLVPVNKMLSPSMRQLMSNVSHDAPVPTAQNLIDELFRLRETKTQELRRRLDAVSGRISVSIGTGSLSGSLHYLAIRAHWIDNGSSFERHDELLDWHCVDGAVTSGDIISIFESTLTRYNLFSRLNTVTTSYNHEFVEFLNQVETICHARGVLFDLGRNQTTCIGSVLLDAREKLLAFLCGGADTSSMVLQTQTATSAATATTNVASGATSTPPTLQSAFTRLCAVVRNMRQPTHPGAEQLVKLCRDRNIDLGKLIDIDRDYPWESAVSLLNTVLPIYTEFAGIYENSPPSNIAATASVAPLTPAEWLILSQTRALLHVLEVAITSLSQCSRQFPSIVDVLPVYDSLIDNVLSLLQSPMLHDDVRRAGDTLQEYLVQCHPFQLSPIYRLAPLFDPRLKATYYVDRGYEQVWTSRVIREAQGMLSEHAGANPASNAQNLNEAGSDVHPVTQRLAQVQQLSNGDVKAQIDAFIEIGMPSTTSQSIADGRARVFKRAFGTGRTELDDYLDAPLAAPNTLVIAWWRMCHSSFPALGPLAREYLAIPAYGNTASLLQLHCAADKRQKQPDYSQLVDLDKKVISTYACLHEWNGS